MEDLFRQLIDRAEAPGGESWLRSCLAQQPTSSSYTAGSSGPEVPPTDDRIAEIDAPAQEEEDERDPRPTKRHRKKRRPYSPPPASQRRGIPAMQQESVRAAQPSRREPQTAGLQQQQETASASSANSGETSICNVSNVSMANNLANFSEMLSKMFQFFSANSVAASSAAVSNLNTSNQASSAGSANIMSSGDSMLMANVVSTENTTPVVTNVTPLTNMSAAWAGSSGVTATSSLPSISESLSMGKGSGIPEACFKEALTCEISPLGYHLTSAIKEKIWRQEFVELLALLPSSKDTSKQSDKKVDDKDDEKKRTAPKSFFNWLQAFTIYASVMGEKQPQLCSGLFRHLEIILEAYRNFGGSGWYLYDEMYRQKLAIHPGVRWGNKDVGLWLNFMLPQRSNPKNFNQQLFRKGVCYAYNDSQCKYAGNCRYRHECAHCSGSHPAAKCLKKGQSNQNNSKEPFLKGSDSSESLKNVTVAKGVPRQIES